MHRWVDEWVNKRKKRKWGEERKKKNLPWPGFEPGLLRPQRNVLTARRSQLVGENDIKSWLSMTNDCFIYSLSLPHLYSCKGGWEWIHPVVEYPSSAIVDVEEEWSLVHTAFIERLPAAVTAEKRIDAISEHLVFSMQHSKVGRSLGTTPYIRRITLALPRIKHKYPLHV